MANNFYNKIAQNVSADHNVPTWLYSVPTSKKTIVIELDVANRSFSSQTISVVIDDFTARDSENDKRAFELAEKSNDAINKMAANLEANTKSMDNLVALVTQR